MVCKIEVSWKETEEGKTAETRKDLNFELIWNRVGAHLGEV